MNKPLHVLFVLENYWPNIGGVEHLFKKLVEQLARNGSKVTVITTRLSPHDPAVEEAGNIRILRYRFYNRYFFTLFALFPVLRNAGACDLIHTTSYNAALPAFLGARLRGKKVVVTFHEVWADLWFRLPWMTWPGKCLHYLFEQMLLRLPFDRFIGVSRFTAGRLVKAGVSPDRVSAVLNGIDYGDFTEKKENEPHGRAVNEPYRPFTYTYFGRLGVSKGLDVLLSAACQFSRQFPDTRLNMIIPTVPRPFFLKIKKEIARLGLEGHVRLLHELPFQELKAELCRSDCAVIPSLSEGFCFAAVECMALGVPIVHSGRGALSEVVSGHFIEMTDHSAEALAGALEKALLGKWDYKPPQRFELKDTVEAYWQLYNLM